MDDLLKLLDEFDLSMTCKSCKMASNTHLLMMVNLSNTSLTFFNFFSGSDDLWSRDTLVTFLSFSYHFQTYGDHMSAPLKLESQRKWIFYA